MILTTPPGGVMTREVGAITGEVEIDVQPDGLVLIRYADADEWYRLRGTAGTMTLEELADFLTTDPGVDADGNPAVVELP